MPSSVPSPLSWSISMFSFSSKVSKSSQWFVKFLYESRKASSTPALSASPNSEQIPLKLLNTNRATVFGMPVISSASSQVSFMSSTTSPRTSLRSLSRSLSSIRYRNKNSTIFRLFFLLLISCFVTFQVVLVNCY